MPVPDDPVHPRGRRLKRRGCVPAFPGFGSGLGDFDRGTIFLKSLRNPLPEGVPQCDSQPGGLPQRKGTPGTCSGVIPPAILTGQAAGTACVRAMEENVPIAQINVTALQRELERQNVLIHFDDADVPDTVVDFHEGNDD